MRLRKCFAALLCLGLWGAPGAAKPKRKKAGSHRAINSRRARTRAAAAPTAKAAVMRTSWRDSAATTLENPAALVPFFEQLYRHEQGALAGPLRIIQYGDSHTASDDWVSAARERFQERFGAGGPGFALAGKPYNYYRRFDLKSAGSNGWHSDGLAGRSGDGRYGLGGVSISTQAAGEWITLTADFQKAELYYLRQPHGGHIQLFDNGALVEAIATDGEVGPGYYRYAATRGEHHLEARTVEAAPVRLFGWSLENEKGVTFEPMGINGATAGMALNWDAAVLNDNLTHHPPALILLEYGTNDASSPDFTPEGFRETFTEVIRKMRAAAPQASIVVIGPPDRWYRTGGRWAPYPRMDAVVRAERAAALANGCAFWDLRARLGGSEAEPMLVQARLAQPDHVHFTHEGYRMLGDLLYHELTAQYDQFVGLRKQSFGKQEEHGQPIADSGHR